jgi:hypothetical protein
LILPGDEYPDSPSGPGKNKPEMLKMWMFFFRYNRVLTESSGIINTTPLPEAYAVKVTPETGIMVPVIQNLQTANLATIRSYKK